MLQERTAPRVVEFLSQEGGKLGGKSSLRCLINKITIKETGRDWKYHLNYSEDIESGHYSPRYVRSKARLRAP